VLRSEAGNAARKHQEIPTENSGNEEQKFALKFWEQIGNKTGRKTIKNEKSAAKTFALKLCSQKQL